MNIPNQFFVNAWLKFYFIITPDEFKEVFNATHFEFIGNKYVNQPFLPTPKEKIWQDYENFFNHILHSEYENGLFEGWFQIDIIDDANKIKWIDKSDEKGVYDCPLPSEPFISLQPFYLLFLEHKQQFYVAYFNSEGTIGMALHYPKSIIWNNIGLTKTDKYPNSNLYNELIKHIKKLCKKAKIRYDNQEFNVNFWISEMAKQNINQNCYLRKNQFFII